MRRLDYTNLVMIAICLALITTVKWIVRVAPVHSVSSPFPIMYRSMARVLLPGTTIDCHRVRPLTELEILAKLNTATEPNLLHWALVAEVLAAEAALMRQTS